MENQSLNLLQLPPELIFIILKNIKAEDLLNVSLVCKDLYSFAMHPLIWSKQILEVRLNNYQKMKLLKEFIEKIKSLKFMAIEYDMCHNHRELTEEDLFRGMMIKKEFIEVIGQSSKMQFFDITNDCIKNKLPYTIPKFAGLAVKGDFPEVLNPLEVKSFSHSHISTQKCKCPNAPTLYNKSCMTKLKIFPNLVEVIIEVDKLSKKEMEVFLYLTKLKCLGLLFNDLGGLTTCGERHVLSNIERLSLIGHYKNFVQNKLNPVGYFFPKLQVLELGPVGESKIPLSLDYILSFIESNKKIRIFCLDTDERHRASDIEIQSFISQLKELDKNRKFFKVYLKFGEKDAVRFGLNISSGKCMKPGCSESTSYFEKCRCHELFDRI